MTRLFLSIAFTAVACGAALAGPLDGRWAWDETICANERGSGDLIPSVFDGDMIRHYETTCTITKMTPIGTQGSAWEVEMACVGEGEESAHKSIFAIDRDETGEPRQLIEIDREEGFVMVRQPCD